MTRKPPRRSKSVDMKIAALSIMTTALIMSIAWSAHIVYASYHQKDQAIVKKLAADSAENSQPQEQKEPKPTDLMKGANRNYASQAYAYDTNMVNGYINGQIPYDGPKLCFLTFDDGVNTTISPQILDILKQYDVHATFYIIGKNVTDETAPVLKREIEEGNAIGMHSYSHDYNAIYPNYSVDPSALDSEIKQTKDVLNKYLGEDFATNTWRYPGGHMSWSNMTAGDQTLWNNSMKWIDWNGMTGDAETGYDHPVTVDGIMRYNEYSLSVYPDYNVKVILMHDAKNKQLTADALPRVIQYYKDNGYQFGILF